MKILITGVAGFIGFSFANFLCKKYKNVNIIGIDNINSYYSQKYKKKRINELNKHNNFQFKKIDIMNYKKLEIIFKKNKFYCIFNFAAQAGVRHSIKEPRNYIDTNYGKKYLPDTQHNYSGKKAKNAQEAHEAIRPTEITRSPAEIKKYLNSDQFKLYELIWNRALSSQMKSAEYDKNLFSEYLIE